MPQIQDHKRQDSKKKNNEVIIIYASGFCWEYNDTFILISDYALLNVHAQ